MTLKLDRRTFLTATLASGAAFAGGAALVAGPALVHQLAWQNRSASFRVV